MFDIAKLVKWVVGWSTAVLIARRIYFVVIACFNTGTFVGLAQNAVRAVIWGGAVGIVVSIILGVGFWVLRKKAQSLGLTGFVNF